MRSNEYMKTCADICVVLSTLCLAVAAQPLLGWYNCFVLRNPAEAYGAVTGLALLFGSSCLGYMFLVVHRSILARIEDSEDLNGIWFKSLFRKRGFLVTCIFGPMLLLVGVLVGISNRGIPVGIVGPFTGDVASYGERVRNGALLALSEINELKDDPNEKLRLIFEDSQCDVDQSVSAVRKLVDVNQVVAVLGDTCSSATYSSGQISQKERVVQLTPISSADNISEIGDYVFRIAPYDGLQAEIVAQWMFDLGHKKVALLYINNDYGLGLTAAFQRHFEALGGSVVESQSFNKGQTNMQALWQNVVNSKPDAVFAPAYPAEAINLLVQRLELGISVPVFGTDPYHDPIVLKGAKAALEGVLFTDVANVDTPEWQAFREAYKAEYGSEPNIVAAQSYDSVKVLAHVIERVGVDRKAIRDGLDEVEDYKGVTGIIEFNEDGDCVTTTFNKFTVENGAYKKL